MKFIIFAQARSGSTSLAKALDLHPSVRIAIEPFHPKYAEWHPDEGYTGERGYIQSIHYRDSLKAVLNEIFQKYDGIKILDYQLDEELYDHMLMLPEYKVIFLRRRNLLQAIVSGLIAEQTGVWQKTDLAEQHERRYQSLQPLSVQSISEKLDYLQGLQKRYSTLLKLRSSVKVLFLDYEELYTSELSENRKTLAKVFSFLGIAMPEDGRFDSCMNPESSKISLASDYSAVPNFNEIEEQFGDSETGHLY